MTTYLVRSGQLRETVEASSASEACRLALEAAEKKYPPPLPQLGAFISAKPSGREAVWKNTADILRELGKLAEQQEQATP